MRSIVTTLLLAVSIPNASAQTSFHLGSKPSKRAELAMPLARCIWQARYADTLSFASGLEKGLKAKAALEQLAALEQSCPSKKADGDIIAAILYSRQSAVGDCLAQNASPAYNAFRKAAKKRESSAAMEFVEKGFPEALKPAAGVCDISLTYDFAQQERIDFGGRVLGW